MTSKLHGLAALLVLGACSTGAAAAGTDSKITLKNNSHWAIHELYFSSAKADDWGPDQLGKHTINTGESFTLTGIPCDKYDVKLVDEDGDACTVEAVAVCGDKDTWAVDDKDLLHCQSKTEQ